MMLLAPECRQRGRRNDLRGIGRDLLAKAARQQTSKPTSQSVSQSCCAALREREKQRESMCVYVCKGGSIVYGVRRGAFSRD